MRDEDRTVATERKGDACIAPAAVRASRRAPGLGFALLLVACAVVWAGGEGSTTAKAQEESSVPPPDSSRIVAARVYQGGRWVARGETPESVGAALAQLEPTTVEALIRFEAGEAITEDEIGAWNTIREAVLATSPKAQFAIELNALEYPTIAKLKAMMAKVRAAFGNAGWMFDFYTPAAKRAPKVMAAAVANAHANGEWIGGNAFGIAKNPPVPAGTDFVAVQDFRFRINLDAVRRLADRVPVYFHLGNSPGVAGSDGCLFIEKRSTKKRIAYVTRRARQQASYKFRYSYPVFYPECARHRHTPRAFVFTYNAPGDDPMMGAISRLLDRYE